MVLDGNTTVLWYLEPNTLFIQLCDCMITMFMNQWYLCDALGYFNIAFEKSLLIVITRRMS